MGYLGRYLGQAGTSCTPYDDPVTGNVVNYCCYDDEDANTGETIRRCEMVDPNKYPETFVGPLPPGATTRNGGLPNTPPGDVPYLPWWVYAGTAVWFYYWLAHRGRSR